MGKLRYRALGTVAALACLATVTAVNAGTITVSLAPVQDTYAFDNNAVGDTSGTTMTAYGLVSWTGKIANGLTEGVSAPPAGDTSNYLFGGPDAPATVTFSHPLNSFDIYWGSIDSLLGNGLGDGRDNIITLLSNNDVLTASDLIAQIPSLLGTGDQFLPTTNAWIRISDTDSFTSFKASVGTPAFEFDMAAPEPSTWAMMIMGFAGLGYAAYRRSGKSAISAFA